MLVILFFLGGTVDISCNEIMETGQLREVYNASGGPWGGNMVNQRMWKLFLTIFGSDVIDKFIDENKDDYRPSHLKKINITSIIHSIFK
jgi:hypothetical protein